MILIGLVVVVLLRCSSVVVVAHYSTCLSIGQISQGFPRDSASSLHADDNTNTQRELGSLSSQLLLGASSFVFDVM